MFNLKGESPPRKINVPIPPQGQLLSREHLTKLAELQEITIDFDTLKKKTTQRHPEITPPSFSHPAISCDTPILCAALEQGIVWGNEGTAMDDITLCLRATAQGNAQFALTAREDRHHEPEHLKAG